MKSSTTMSRSRVPITRRTFRLPRYSVERDGGEAEEDVQTPSINRRNVNFMFIIRCVFAVELINIVVDLRRREGDAGSEVTLIFRSTNTGFAIYRVYYGATMRTHKAQVMRKQTSFLGFSSGTTEYRERFDDGR